MHPQLRISSDIKELTCSEASKGIQLRVILTTLTSQQWEEFRAFETKLIISHASDVSKDISQVSRQRSVRPPKIAIFQIYSCNKVNEIANQLANRPEVLWIERKYQAHTFNRFTKGLCQTGDVSNAPMYHYNFSGIHEIIGVSDTGIDMHHCFFRDPDVSTPYDTISSTHRKLITYNTFQDNKEGSSGHGSHVCGTIAGLSENSYGGYEAYKGVAYEAKIAFLDIAKTTTSSSSDDNSVDPPNDLYSDYFELFYDVGARIFSNSWGTEQNTYNTQAGSVDEFMADYPDAIVFFAAGNSGDSGNMNINNFGTNKNGVTVGASLNDINSWKSVVGETDVNNINSNLNKDNLASFSSVGPTKNNFLKPDLVAPGYFIYSAHGTNSSSNHCDLAGLSGTSMATPVVAGFAALIRQYLRSGYYPSGSQTLSDGFIPSGALIKAILIHSTQKLNKIVKYNSASSVTAYNLVSRYPNVYEGYGRIQLNKVLNFDQATMDPINLFLVGSVNSTQKNYAELTNTNKMNGYVFKTSSTISGTIRVTMVYTDPVSSAGSFSIVNNITVTVHDSNGNTFQRYIPSDAPQFSNTQVIDILSPTASTVYTVNVTVHNTLAISPQPYSLVISGEVSFLPDYYQPYDYTANNYSKDSYTSSAMIYIGSLGITSLILICLMGSFRQIALKKNIVAVNPKMIDQNAMEYDIDLQEHEILNNPDRQRNHK